MRSKGSLGRPDDAAAFGALVAELAIKAGYDLTPGGNGRRRLADDTGMSLSAVGRMLRGETLPRPENIVALAGTLHADERHMLNAVGITLPDHTKQADAVVRSFPQASTPEAIADFLGITLPHVRKMLTSIIEQALRLQREADSIEDGEDGGTAVGT